MNFFSKNHILLSYLMIPLGVIIVLTDHLFLNLWFQNSTPTDPHSLFIFNLIFGLPHVLAGNIQLLDNEYIKFHKTGLIICCLFSLLFPWSIISGLGIGVFITMEYGISSFHAAGQQVGIATLFSSFDRRFYSVWKWSTRIVIAITAIRAIEYKVFSTYFDGGLDHLILALLFTSTVTGLMIYRSCDKKVGKVYILANLLMTYSIYSFQQLNYPFISILCLRLPHDVTAFLFYMNHSRIRNKNVDHNWLVRFFPLPNFMKGYFLPLLTIPLAFFLDSWEIFFLANAFFSYLHYTSENFFWRGNGLALKSVQIN